MNDFLQSLSKEYEDVYENLAWADSCYARLLVIEKEFETAKDH